MSKISIILTLLITLEFISSQLCHEGENNCKKCHPLRNVCSECLFNVYEPDEIGGCTPLKKCSIGENYCSTCNSNQNLCLVCEIGYYPDENGGCSFSDNCEISYKGECLKCNNDFSLISSTKICKYNYSEDFLNCKIINTNNGFCDICEDNYFLTQEDKKCISTNNCLKSTFGICQQCINNYYLDKTDDLCKEEKNQFINCKLTIDGQNCNEYKDGFYPTEDGNYISVNFCKKSNDSLCIECISNYYLTKYENVCTKEKNCINGDKKFGICTECSVNFYLDLKDGFCKSNQEENNFRNCKIVYENNCLSCNPLSFLSEDKKCTLTLDCLTSENGYCTSCKENTFLNLNHFCTKIEHCIYSYNFDDCSECEQNFYYNQSTKKCIETTEQLKNCKIVGYSNKCIECKNNFYLSNKDNLCYDNSEQGPLYKCKKTDGSGEICISCEDDYFLGDKDNICSKVEGCALSENENKCVECSELYCLDVKKGICFTNYDKPMENDKLIYYNCNKTNEEGTKCVECIDDNYVVQNGFCYNIAQCDQIVDNLCLNCKENNTDMPWYFECLNQNFGCVDTEKSNCYKCNDNFDFDKCSECKDGYVLNENNECIENNNEY